MAITLFQPAVWSALILSILEKNLVYGSSICSNRNYEGDITGYGSSVKITSIGTPTISDYTKDTDMTTQVLTDTQQVLNIDQAKSFNFEIDDIDDAQVRNGGALMAEASEKAGYALRDTADQYLVSKMVAGAGSGLGLVDASSTATNVYDLLVVPAAVKLDQNNVPSDGRFLVIDPATYGKLQLDTRFIRQNESGTQALHTGVVGMAAGFTILKSNNAVTSARTGLTGTTHTNTTVDGAAAATFSQADVGLTITGTGIPSSTTVSAVSADGTTVTLSQAATASATISNIAIVGGGKVAVAGTNAGNSYAEQINKVEAFRPQKRFADALKGLHLYGAKVVRPEALVVASVKTS